MELKDLVRIDFEPLENHKMLISDFQFMNTKITRKQKKLLWYKANSSLQMEKCVTSFLMLSFQSCQMLN